MIYIDQIELYVCIQFRVARPEGETTTASKHIYSSALVGCMLGRGSVAAVLAMHCSAASLHPPFLHLSDYYLMMKWTGGMHVQR